MIKAIHMAMVGLSISLFMVRALAMLAGASFGMSRPVRLLSYTIDTVLFAAALSLLSILQLNPFTTAWLGVKMLLLLAYIVLGSLALKRGRTPRVRRVALLAALLCFAQMFAVARTHNALGWLAQPG